MKNLANALGMVTVVLEQLWKGHDVRRMNAEMCWQIPHFQLIGTLTRQQRSPRRIAHRLLAVSMFKQGRARSKSINIGGLNMLLSITPQFNSQIINRNEQYISGCPVAGEIRIPGNGP